MTEFIFYTHVNIYVLTLPSYQTSVFVGAMTRKDFKEQT